MSGHPCCSRPDVDEPRITCGHPLPCPHHTVVIEGTSTETVVTIPIHASAATPHYPLLLDIGDAVCSPPAPTKKGRRR